MSESSRPSPCLHDRYRLQRLWLPAYVMAGVTLLSGTPGPQLGPMAFAGVDKIGHFVVFGLLGVAWVRCLDPTAFGPVLRLLLATLLTGLFGLLDELHQFHTPGRFFEWADLIADFAGAFAWSAAYIYLKGWRAFLERELRSLWRLPSSADPANSR